MNVKDKLLLCCDLDRTVLPNGHYPESAGARDLFRRLTQEESVSLAYVSGRDRRLLLQAIEQYQIPLPDYAIGDVGTTIYRITDGNWSELASWSEHIAKDWHGVAADDIMRYLSAFESLKLQEREKQNRFKVSYYTPAEVDVAALKQTITAVFEKQQIKANLIWSIDEIENTGLLDILPARANKRHAIEFLMNALGVGNAHTVFAGDSGNDLEVIVSDIPSVLVRNASDEVRQEAEAALKSGHHTDSIYLATGGFHGMNGNYSAGVLEGVVHYHPGFEALFKPE